LRGLENLVEDLQRGDGDLEISKTRYEAFEVGKNLATTEGSVVYQNDLMQLIQYTPSTKTVFKTPLLILPPWINKYYILDMRPENSFIKWAVDQGHSVFVISWVNPDKKLSQKSFESYMKEGLIEALDQIEKQTGEPQANVVGYCIGGTLLATSLAYLTAHKQDKRVASATFLTTLIDFHQAGDLSIFVDDEYLKIIDEKMDKAGYLEGSNLRQTFSLLRANDLIWSFVVNNYMLGKEPFPFDLLYWNDDSTNMPAEMHRFYLRNMYRDNKLCKAGGIKIGKTPIDVSKIKVPSYFISTKEDHIAPWKSTYEGMMLLDGKKRFVLAASGHVAGVINPPAANKYHYWVNDKIDDREHAEEWLDQAEQRDGSWWSDWAEWVKAYAGKQVSARDPKKGKLKVIEPAPGSYIKMKGD
jgi:polyhydroxyalkanoate synthase